MHLALVPWLLFALVGGTGNGAATHALAPASNFSSPHTLYSVAAQATTTATTTISATATSVVSGTATVAQSTPVPLATATAGSSLQINPFDWAFLTSVPEPPLGPFAIIYGVLMLVLFGVSAYFYFFKRIEWKRTNPVLRRAAERWAPIFMWISGLTLLFLVFRVVKLDFFDLRIWLYIWALIALIAAGWFFYWYRAVYPKEMAKYTKTQRARQYMPGAAKKGSVPQPATSQIPKSTAPSSSSESKRRRRR